MELILQKSRADAYAQGHTDLLAHIVHANSRGHILLRRTLVQTDELCREGYATEEAEWEGGKNFLPDAYNFHAVVSFCFSFQSEITVTVEKRNEY